MTYYQVAVVLSLLYGNDSRATKARIIHSVELVKVSMLKTN
jgi:hypothetical protein